MTQRWAFYDTVALDTVTLRWNPNKMTTPYLENVTTLGAVSPIDGLVRATRRKPPPRTFSFGGFIREQTQHDALLALSARKTLLRVTDHLNRTFEIRMLKFDVTEKTPTKAKPWRLEYTMRCLTYGKYTP